MDIVVPTSLLAEDPGESPKKLIEIKRQKQRSLALSLGFSATRGAPETDGSCYFVSPSLSSSERFEFPPLVLPPVTTDPFKRRKTIATIGHDFILRNDTLNYLPFSSYQPSTQHDKTVSGMTGLKASLSPLENNSVAMPSYQRLLPVSTVKSFFELSALWVDDKMVQFSKFDKHMILVANVASGDKNAIREYTQLNDLAIAYGTRGLTILAFPCNQFGGCEPYDNHELLNCLRYVRPGRNFKPRFHLMAKCDVYGPTAHPVFEYLKQRIPVPCDVTHQQQNYVEIAGNFEKFLISPDGVPLKRYTAKTRAAALAFDIEEVVSRTFPNRMAKSKLNLFEVQADSDTKIKMFPEETGTKRRRESRIPVH